MHKIVDAHVHTAFESILLRESARVSEVDYSIEGLRREMRESNVQYAISMGLKSSGQRLLSQEAETPIVDYALDDGVILIGGVNPYRAGQENLLEVEKALSSGRIKGIKIYLGYFDRYAYDDVYKRFYELAAEYRAPVIFHTGDNYDRGVKVK